MWNSRYTDKVLFTCIIAGASDENKTTNMLHSGLLQAALLETMDGALGISGYVIIGKSPAFNILKLVTEPVKLVGDGPLS